MNYIESALRKNKCENMIKETVFLYELEKKRKQNRN